MNDPALPPVARDRAVFWVVAAMEAVVLTLACLSPWAFGSVHPYFEFYLLAGVAVLLFLWAARMVLERRLTWAKCPVALCLAGLFLVGVVQTLPVPSGLLQVLSPGTVGLLEQLLPGSAEALAGGAERLPAVLPAGSSISLYPGASRAEAVRLLAVFLLFAVVRNNLGGVAALRRLSIAALVNGALLALYALAQFFTGPRNSLFWTFLYPAEVFGPFICRNHFPFYVNMCVGLGFGLLLASWRESSFRSGRSRWRRLLRAPVRLLQEPAAIWIAVGLALMLAAVALSLSRGGMIALAGAWLVCLLIRLAQSHRRSHLEIELLLVPLAVGLVGWFGIGQVQSRLATSLSESTLTEGRLPSWRNSLSLARDFPLLGTGLGTYRYVEPLRRRLGEDPGLVWDHAHNDYLEALVEGGIVRLGLSLLAIVLVCRLGYRAVRDAEGRSARALAIGALFAFATILIHGFSDFGLHLPAIAFLATVIAAQLCSVGSAADGEQPSEPARPSGGQFELAGAAPYVGAVVAVLLGLILYGAGEKNERAERFRLAASRLAGKPEPVLRRRQVDYLDAAVRVAPENGDLHVDCGQAHLDRYQEQKAIQDRQAALLRAAATVPLLAAPADLTTGVVQVSLASRCWTGAWPARENERLFRQDLYPAIQHFLVARDLNPLLVQPQLRLAGLAVHLEKADPRGAYLARARLLRPHDAEVWYLSGAQHWLDGQSAPAHACWRHSLECSPRFLKDILQSTRATLDDANLVGKVLPDNPRVLLAAGDLLYPTGAEAEERRPFADKALQLLEQEPGPSPPDNLYLRARAYRSRGSATEAVRAYRAALVQAPQQLAWRYELAEMLAGLGLVAEARAELTVILAAQPGHAQAGSLLRELTRQTPERR